jgi:hypothetical protein
VCKKKVENDDESSALGALTYQGRVQKSLRVNVDSFIVYDVVGMIAVVSFDTVTYETKVIVGEDVKGDASGEDSTALYSRVDDFLLSVVELSCEAATSTAKHDAATQKSIVRGIVEDH